MSRLLTLENWAKGEYGEDAPAIGVLRAWARTGRISPPPQKHGRTYFVSRDARYAPPARGRRRLVERINGSEKGRG